MTRLYPEYTTLHVRLQSSQQLRHRFHANLTSEAEEKTWKYHGLIPWNIPEIRDVWQKLPNTKKYMGILYALPTIGFNSMLDPIGVSEWLGYNNLIHFTGNDYGKWAEGGIGRNNIVAHTHTQIYIYIYICIYIYIYNICIHTHPANANNRTINRGNSWHISQDVYICVHDHKWL